MTRETKVGLIVAGSFVCLIAVVVASRLNKPNDEGNGPVAQGPTQQGDGGKKNPPPQTVIPAHVNLDPTAVPALPPETKPPEAASPPNKPQEGVVLPPAPPVPDLINNTVVPEAVSDDEQKRK